MKKIAKLITLILSITLVSGCNTKEQTMDDINIYTTTYPINFIINELYEEHAKVYSVYPTGVDVNSYELSNRKLEEYSKSDLFVFNSLDKDRDYAVKMINLNSKLKVIDVATDMDYTYSIEELWLSPNNFLMMAENLKKGLAEYINNPYLVEEIDEKYETLEYEISKLDATLTETITSANYNTIVVDNDMFKFLEKYGLTVISLEDNESLSTNTVEEVKNLIKNGKIKYIYSNSNKSNSTVEKLVSDNDIELITINAMHSTDGNITNSNDNYLTIMNNNIDSLKKELYK